MKFLKQILVAVALLWAGGAYALTPAQLTTLKAAIVANPTWSAFPMTADGYFDLARELNKQAVPDYTVWRTNVPVAQVGVAINSTELAGLTTANTSRLQVMVQYSGGSFDPSKSDVRAGFDSVFSGAGGTLTRASLLVLWKRLATYGEKILSTGTGSNAAPATMGFEGLIQPEDVQQARNL